MKRSALFIAFFVLLHLLVIDLTFYAVTTGASNSIVALGLYNIVWLFIAALIGKHSYSESSSN